MNSPLAIGVDIGGTKLAFVLLDRAGNVLAEHRLPTQPQDGAEAVMDRVAQGISQLMALADRPLLGIGVGCPGNSDRHSGVVRNAVNLMWTEVALVDGLRARLRTDLPIYLQKDATAGALGEYYFGAGQGHPNFAYLAIGTGLGAGAVVDGRLIHGANEYALAIGHVAVNPQGRLCRCGKRGCPEMYVSGVGLVAAVNEYRTTYPASPLADIASPTTEDLIAAMRARDALALRIWMEAKDWLVLVMAFCAGILNPDLFVLGGGLGRAMADLLLDDLQSGLYERTLPASHQDVRVVESQITASAIGPACLVWYYGEQ